MIRDGKVTETVFSIGGLTADERKVLTAGCLINFYRGEK